MPIRQPKQSKNLTAVLGDAPVQLTIYGVWLTGIITGAILIAIIVYTNLLSNTPITRANLASADSTDANMVNINAQLIGTGGDYATLITQGKTLFSQRQCNTCHQLGGTSSNGIGPRLDRSFNARDASYISKIVRQGVNGNYSPKMYTQYSPANGMPFFKTANDDVYPYYITDEELYKVTVYLRSIQAQPRGPAK